MIEEVTKREIYSFDDIVPSSNEIEAMTATLISSDKEPNINNCYYCKHNPVGKYREWKGRR
jgi:hypothetical protein